jgi:hypothetical protein
MVSFASGIVERFCMMDSVWPNVRLGHSPTVKQLTTSFRIEGGIAGAVVRADEAVLVEASGAFGFAGVPVFGMGRGV